MAHVDALSRPPHCMLIQNSVHLQFLKAQQADDQITTIKTLLETTPHDNYIVKNKLLYKTVNGTDLLVVPDEMQANIIKTAHERGHFAVLNVKNKTPVTLPDDSTAPSSGTELAGAGAPKVRIGIENLDSDFRNSLNFAGYCRN
ncbi:transposon Ty3-I Gag-Pol polyprotein [Trichonephila clavipes]|nr:transposon Ty3-I Gag-Pol polyprotein [Trichonephila clavipes]